MKVLILSSRARTILKYSCSLTKTVVILDNQKTCGVRSPDTLESPTISRKIQALSGCLVVAQSSRSSDRCLLHWRPPCGALDRFLGRLYSMYSFSGPVVLLLRQMRAQTNHYCNPIPGSLLWFLALGTRSLLSCGRWFLPHWRCPQSALGPWCLRLLLPIGA